jgi:hypothetical protein
MSRSRLKAIANLSVLVGLILAASSAAFAQQTEFSNDDPRRAKCQEEAMAWSKNDTGVGVTGPFQKAVPFVKLTDEAAEMCDCAVLYPHTDNTVHEMIQNPTNFYLPYSFLCTRYSGEEATRLIHFLARHPEMSKQFLAEDAQGKR